MSAAFRGGTVTMIVARCKDCNYVARYNSKYHSITELQRHVKLESVIDDDDVNLCNHDLNFWEGDEDN